MSEKLNEKTRVYNFDAQEMYHFLISLGNVTEHYDEMQNLITQLMILSENYYDSSYDRTAVFDCIFSSVHSLFNADIYECNLIQECNTI